MTRIYNQKKHEQAIAGKPPQHPPCGYYDERKFDFLNPDVELNDEIDE